MSFMIKKKQFKFSVNLEVEELSSVPYINAVLFVKVRLINGGTFTSFSTRQEVVEHCVKWKSRARFTCKMSACATTGVLEHCLCRLSVRKELKGGQSSQKLGFADINLAEYAGAGLTSRKYLLEGYDTKRRQDNSMLLVNIEMSLLSSDPVFLAPRPDNIFMQMFPEVGGGSHLDGIKGSSEESVGHDKNGINGSLPRKDQKSLTGNCSAPNVFFLTPSSESVESGAATCSGMASGGVSCKASRSECSVNNRTPAPVPVSHIRQSSDSVVVVRGSVTDRDAGYQTSSMNRTPKKQDSYTLTQERKVDSTRVNNDELIDGLMSDFCIEDTGEKGLKFIVVNGQTVLG